MLQIGPLKQNPSWMQFSIYLWNWNVSCCKLQARFSHPHQDVTNHPCPRSACCLMFCQMPKLNSGFISTSGNSGTGTLSATACKTSTKRPRFLSTMLVSVLAPSPTMMWVVYNSSRSVRQLTHHLHPRRACPSWTCPWACRWHHWRSRPCPWSGSWLQINLRWSIYGDFDRENDQRCRSMI